MTTPLLFCCCILLFLLLLHARAQTNQTIQQVDQSVTNIVPLYQNRASRAWLGPNGLYTLFGRLNAARTNLSLALAPLVSYSASVVISNALSPSACPVLANPLQYLNNATTYEAFLCCQLSPWMLPGLPAVISAIYADILPGTPSIDWSTSAGILSVEQIRAIDINNTNIVRCKDDVRIHIPEAELVLAKTVGAVAGTVLRSLQYAEFVANSLEACLSVYPTPPACLSTSPSSLSAAAINNMLSFYQLSPPFQRVCGQAALAKFEAFRTATTWCAL